MQLSELLARVRDPYVAHFQMALRSQPGDEILVEPAPRDQTGSPVCTGALALPCRVDVLLKSADGLSPLRLVTPTGVTFEPIEVPDWGWALRADRAVRVVCLPSPGRASCE